MTPTQAYTDEVEAWVRDETLPDQNPQKLAEAREALLHLESTIPTDRRPSSWSAHARSEWRARVKQALSLRDLGRALGDLEAHMHIKRAVRTWSSERIEQWQNTVCSTAGYKDLDAQIKVRVYWRSQDKVSYSLFR